MSSATITLADCQLVPQRLLLTAGVGNESLLAKLGANEPLMQRRPLQQVIVKHQYPETFFGHCTGGTPSPRLTVSSHMTSAGEPVWYLGGDLATEHAEDDPQRLIEKARNELDSLLPWVEFGQRDWRTIKLDRAEPRQNALLRPDRAFVGRADSVDNTLVAWPTKLSLSPDLGDEVERFLREDGIAPTFPQDLGPLSTLPTPDIAPTCWDELF